MATNCNYSPPAKIGALAEAATKEARNTAEFGGSRVDPDLERARREFFEETPKPIEKHEHNKG